MAHNLWVIVLGYIHLGLYTHDPDWPNPRDFYRETAIGLANGEILILYYAYDSKYPLYSFDGDQWAKRSVEISTVDNSFMKNQVLVQILTIKNYDNDK